MTFKSYFVSSDPIFKDLKILNIFKINEYLTSLFIIRYFYLQNLPEIFDNYFLSNKEIHNHNTRDSLRLHKKGNRTNYRKLTLANKGIEVWNNVPKQYKEPRSYDFFKLMLKKYFLHAIRLKKNMKKILNKKKDKKILETTN